jgi:hypothetical protein
MRLIGAFPMLRPPEAFNVQKGCMKSMCDYVMTIRGQLSARMHDGKFEDDEEA